MDFQGKLILESETSLAMAPDGNGGIYNALKHSGALADMSRRGVEHLHIYGVDNILTKSADPRFIGMCIHEESQIGNKVVWRANQEVRYLSTNLFVCMHVHVICMRDVVSVSHTSCPIHTELTHLLTYSLANPFPIFTECEGESGCHSRACREWKYADFGVF